MANLGPYTVAFVLGASVASLPQVAEASPQEAEELFQRGLRLMTEGQVARGCDLLEESHALDPLPGALFTLAECRARADEPVLAWERFREYLDEVAADGPAEEGSQRAARIEAAQKRLGELEERLARLTVVVDAGEGAQVFIDGRPLPPSRWDREYALTPGTYKLSLQSEQGAPQETTVTLGAGEARRIHLALPRAAKEPAAPIVQPPEESERTETPTSVRLSSQPPAGSEPAVVDTSSRGPSLWTYTAFGVGAAGLVTGSIAGAILISRKNTVDRYCTGAVCQDEGYAATQGIGTFDTIANVGFATAGVGLGVGLLLLLTGENDSRPEVARVHFDFTGDQALLRGQW